ncbi:hypothetical protein [Mesorhizobium sp. DCY119]|uniref:hypothetical protein n=1 Tax=Mesorhizobium sp. DCY119 TaxID=2108445 RepID=UPI000E6C1B00|nr:hypothetical protein [Mesorhizobium sp. DCY119]RJG43720.1 hypothetical protein D3Y55_05235 [Mesorhizobium sp. DCY119]
MAALIPALVALIGGVWYIFNRRGAGDKVGMWCGIWFSMGALIVTVKNMPDDVRYSAAFYAPTVSPSVSIGEPRVAPSTAIVTIDPPVMGVAGVEVPASR